MRKIKLFFDRKNGEAWYQGEYSIISQRSAQSLSLRGAERYLGRGAGIIVYNASKNIAKKRFYEKVRGLKVDDRNVIKSVLEYLSMCGYGLFRIKDFGKETIIEVRNSSNALNYHSERPVCYFIAGYLAGIMELITGKECLCTEESCIAKGDKVCTFRIMMLPSQKDAAPVKEWWKSKMPKGIKETFMDYDEKKGEIFYMKMASSIVTARPELSELQKEFERIIGPAYKTIMYDRGRYTTTEAISQMRKFVIKLMRMFSKRRILERLLEQFPERGYGVAELLDLDEKKATGRIVLRNSYNAIGYSKVRDPQCYVVAGIFASGFDIVLGRRMRCKETKCIAKGDPYCEFEVYPER